MTSQRKSVLSGDLAAIALADVLSFLSMVRKTGILTVTRSSVSKSVFFDAGQVVFASSTEFKDSLGPFLVESGRIGSEDNLAASKQVTPSRRLGRVLVEMGLLSPNDLWSAVREQVLEIIYSLFSWNQGYFAFYETPEPSREKIVIDIPTANIIMEGIRRYDEWNRIRERIPGEHVVFELARDRTPELAESLTPEERSLLALVDGQRSILDITRATGLGKMETQKSLYSLLSGGVLRPVETGAALTYREDANELLGVLGTYNYIFQLLYKVTVSKVGAVAESLFTDTLREEAPQELFAGLNWNQEGQLPENLLIANVSELPWERRRKVLSDGLNSLLSTLVTRAGRHLSEPEKAKVYQIIARVTVQ